MSTATPLTVLTVYSPSSTFTPEYIHRLHAGVSEHLSVPHRFVVLSPVEIDGVETIITPPWPVGHFAKIYMFWPILRGRLLYIDLATVVNGSLDDIATQEDTVITRDFYHGGPSQSILLYETNQFSGLWHGFWDAPERWIEQGARCEVPDFHDQVLVNHLPVPQMRYWQDVLPGQVVSWKVDCRNGVPPDARLVKFHGQPKPHDVGWLTGPQYEATLNTPREAMVTNVHANLERGLPLLEEAPAHDRTMALVGGGPSLADSVDDLVTLDGAASLVDVFALNGAHDYLIQHGVFPRYHVLLDARPEIAEFVASPHPYVTYLVAAQCDAAVFEALARSRVRVWAAEMRGLEAECLRIGGGATVGMKALYLGYVMGYRRFHLYGMDSSYRRSHHAYAQPLNDDEDQRSVFVGDREFICAPWMIKQAQEFQNQAAKLTSLGCELTVTGDGLIPYVASLMTPPRVFGGLAPPFCR